MEFEGYRTDGVTGFALDYMRTWDKNQPYFLFLSHIEPHHQNDHRRFEGPEGSKERFAGFNAPKDLAFAPGDWGSDWQTQYPDYLGCCSRLDYNLGRVLACVKEMGLEDDTVIIYASDHGSHFKTRTVEYKRSCHDGSIHIRKERRGACQPHRSAVYDSDHGGGDSTGRHEGPSDSGAVGREEAGDVAE